MSGAHLAIVNSPQLKLDREFYDNIIALKPNRKPVYREYLQPHTGDAYLVKAGQVLRAEQVGERAQILDWFMISPDLTEYLNYGHSAPLEGPYLSTYSRCWSNSGYLHPMATMVADEVPDDWVPNKEWAKHFWMFHCNPEWNQCADPSLPVGFSSCHTNFMHGMARIPAIHAMPEQEKRATIEYLSNMCNFMTFQLFRTGWDEEAQRVIMDTAPGPNMPKGTGVEFYAEQDVYMVISSCPWGDHQAHSLGENVIAPVEISVWETGIKPQTRPEWREWKSEFYRQLNGGDRANTPRTEDSYNLIA